MPDSLGSADRRIAIIGGGFTGSLAALKLAAEGLVPVLIERSLKAGPGLAYGAAQPHHVLNVPVNRMEIGLSPTFADWLHTFPDETAAAIEEAGDLMHAFVPRSLYGRYLQAQVDAAVTAGQIRRIRGEVVNVQKRARTYGLGLADGREISATHVVLATGNPPPKAPNIRARDGTELADCPAFVCDPWSAEALAHLPTDAPVLLIGTGLTMADIALNLTAQGHTGPIYVLSRRGLLPLPHVAGGSWPAFLNDCIGHSPLKVLRRLKAEAKRAMAQGIPWQRVLDAARPHVAQIWAAWSRSERSRFLRLARPYWDVHRHRVAPHVFTTVSALQVRGQLIAVAGELTGFEISNDLVTVIYRGRGQPRPAQLSVSRIINCTGPRSDYADLGLPLFASLRAQGLIHPDWLKLGIETRDVQVIDGHGRVSNTVFAIGALTRPAWWEVTAVPEINVQASRLVELAKILLPDSRLSLNVALASELFEVGAGI